ncbi:MAG: thioredoxin [Caldilineae bacterium]|nr:MAG: thioredoxin [Caldilineae bacterium]
MLERTILFFLFLTIVTAALALYRWRLHSHVRRLSQNDVAGWLADFDLPLRPAILYFTTPDCAQCRFQQRPALARLQQTWGEAVHILTLDAIEHDDLARHFHVLTVPTTIVLDTHRNVIAVNHGLAPAERLEAQLRPLLEHPPRPPRPQTLALSG